MMSLPDGSYTGELVIAGAIVLAVIVLLGLSRKVTRSALVGFDGRASTSRTIALGWTAVIGFMTLTVGLMAAKHGSNFLGTGLHELGGTYLALLGGPFAGLVGSAAIVGAKVASGQIQKSSDGFSLADITRDDRGNVDLVDLQYTLFNLIAALVLMIMFVRHPAHGLPRIPAQFVALTLGPAGIYLTNKAVVRNPVRVTSITPSTAARGERVVVFGQNFAPTGPGGLSANALEDPIVTLGGIPAEKVKGAVTGERIIVVVPEAAPMGKPLDVKVTTGAGNEDTCHGALEVVASATRPRSASEPDAVRSDAAGSNGAPVILRLSREDAAPGQPIAIVGENLTSRAGAGVSVRVESEPARLLGNPSADRVVFSVPDRVPAGPARVVLTRGEDSEQAATQLEIVR